MDMEGVVYVVIKIKRRTKIVQLKPLDSPPFLHPDFGGTSPVALNKTTFDYFAWNDPTL